MTGRSSSHLRAVRADAVAGPTWYLLKHVPVLRLTYQIRLLTFRAMQTDDGQLVIRVPSDCHLSGPLSAFVADHRAHVQVERV